MHIGWFHAWFILKTTIKTLRFLNIAAMSTKWLVCNTWSERKWSSQFTFHWTITHNGWCPYEETGRRKKLIRPYQQKNTCALNGSQTTVKLHYFLFLFSSSLTHTHRGKVESCRSVKFFTWNGFVLNNKFFFTFIQRNRINKTKTKQTESFFGT